ncbi:MAG: peptidylprolyl isomerase [Planctomycetota bacterium]
MVGRAWPGLLLLACTVSCSFTATDRASDSAVPGGVGRDQTVIAVVDDLEITASDLERRILARYYGRRALEGVIREELFVREAKRLGIEVSAGEVELRVEAEVRELAAPFDGDTGRLESDLVASGLTLADYREELRLELANVLLLERVVKKRRERGGITEKAIREEYERSYAQDRVLVRHVAFPVNAPPSAVDRFEVELQEAKRRADRVQLMLIAGEDFERLARLESGDRSTAAHGGLVGWVARGDLRDTELETAVFALEVGQVSAPVQQRDYGYHIFKVEGRREASSLEDVRETIRAALLEAPPSPEEVRSAEMALRARSRILIFMPAPVPAQERTGE